VLAFTRLYFDKAIAAFNYYKINMTFSKIKLFGFLALSYSLIACGQTPVSTASNATPNAIAQTTTAAQPTETPVTVAKSPEPQPSVTQVLEKSPEPQSSAVASTKVETAISQPQDDSAKTTVAQQPTDVDAETLYKTFEEISEFPCIYERVTEKSTIYSICTAGAGYRGERWIFSAGSGHTEGDGGITYWYYPGGRAWTKIPPKVAAISFSHDGKLFMFDQSGKLQAELFRDRSRSIRTTFTKAERDRLENLAQGGGADIFPRFPKWDDIFSRFPRRL
jgi:hypothetical protein